jgi:uncharacterized protein YodC (DUF2158 family)
MTRKFKPGDWVKFKGRALCPKMEVLKYVPKKDPVFGTINNDTYLECVWYKNGERHIEVFNQNRLIKMVGVGGFYKV